MSGAGGAGGAGGTGPGPRGRLRRVFRYVPFTIVQDPTAEPEYAARCVSGEEADCGAESGAWCHPAGVEDWQRRHTQETRHLRYRRTFGDYAVLEPSDGGPDGAGWT